MRRRWTIKLVLALLSLVPDVVSFVVDHVPSPEDPAVQQDVRSSGCPDSPALDAGTTHG
jgi:hypothetical protein